MTAAGTPGLQRERTALAWQRTGLSAAGVAALGLLAAAHDGRAWLVAGVATLAAGGALASVLTVASAAATAHGRGASPWPRLLATCAATCAAALAGLLLALPPQR